jgi:signal transduction histidine kinase
MTNHRPTLLVVDDEPEVLHSVHDLLRLDYRVLTCERGADALKVLESSEDIHVVMSDQRMPGMTGVEVLRQAKRLRPEATRLMFTAYADIKAVVDAINQGSVFRYIAKPWDPEELQSVVRQAVEQHDLIVERSRLMTELKETNQRLVEANRLKGAFIEVASHELNTPVAVVLGMAQLWKLTQGETSTPTERHWVDRIFSAGKRLAATVERMLKLVRSDDLSRPLDLQPTQLDALVRRVVDDMGSFLRARRQEVELDLDPLLGEALIDPAKIGDVLTNLLINAIKFTPDAGTIRVSAGPEGLDRVRFVVTDEGAGIDPSLRPFLFEPFFTGFDTLHHSSGDFEFGKRGIGLGLSLVKRFAELHGGDVEVHSAPGAGSTFAVTIPRHPPGSSQALNARAG